MSGTQYTCKLMFRVVREASFRDRIDTLLRQSTRLHNWLLTRFLELDRRPISADEPLEAWQRPSLYRAARESFPELPSGLVTATERELAATYRRIRRELLVDHSLTLPWFRHPAPARFRAQDYRVTFLETGTLLVDFPVSAGRGSRIRVPLKMGRRHHRDVVRLRELLESGGRPRAMQVGQDFKGRYTIHISFQASVARKPGRVIDIRTAESCLIQSGDSAPERLSINADHVRQWVKARQQQHRRLTQDMNQMRRDSKHVARLRRLERSRQEKHRRRMRSACQQIASMVGDFVEHSGGGKVRYDDTCRSYVSPFPWDLLRHCLAQALAKRGIQLTREADDISVAIPANGATLPSPLLEAVPKPFTSDNSLTVETRGPH